MKNSDIILQNRLSERERLGLLRTLRYPNPVWSDFCSNDYLGLAQCPELFQQINDACAALPLKMNGSTGSRLLSGNNAYAEETEVLLAKIFKGESSLLFNSGYSANLSVLSSIPQRHDTIIYDEFAHACIKDGARLSLAKRMSFRHNDLNDLESKIKRASGNIFIAVESIYSMDGDECPLKELTLLAKNHGATLVLDEAHSTGVIGINGAGLAVSLGLEDEVDIRIYTFGKAMGVHGASVVGSKNLRSFLINFARPFIYTTAMTPHSIASIRCSFNYLNQNMKLQQKLDHKIQLYLDNISDVQNRTNSLRAIQTILIKGNENTKKTALELQRRNLDVRAILSPTVAPDSERLRICLHTFNSDEEIIDLTQQLKTISVQA